MPMTTINIDIVEHRNTGLLVATSTDLKGFMAHGSDLIELERNIEEALAALFKANGKPVIAVKMQGDGETEAFVPRSLSYDLETVAA